MGILTKKEYFTLFKCLLLHLFSDCWFFTFLLLGGVGETRQHSFTLMAFMRKTILNSVDQFSTQSHLTCLIFSARLFPPLIGRNFLKIEYGIKKTKTPKPATNQTQKLSLSTMRHLRQRSINCRGNRKGVRGLSLHSEWGTTCFLDMLRSNNCICCKPTLPSVLWDTSREDEVMGTLGTNLSLGDR